MPQKSERKVAGEGFIFAASVLTFVATLLLIFVHIGQVNTGSTRRSIAMAEVNVSGYGDALHAAFSDPILGLYTNNATAPLNVRAGLRQLYKFGLYSHCAYVNGTAGLCTNITAGYTFYPYTVITGDMLSNYSSYTNAIIGNTTFATSSSLGKTHTAYYLLLLGSILAFISFVVGLFKDTKNFFISTICSCFSTIFVLSACVIWTTAIKEAERINLSRVDPVKVPIGIEVSAGPGFYLSWAAFAFLVTGAIPYAISLFTYRG